MKKILALIFLVILCSQSLKAQQPLFYGLCSEGGSNNRGVLFRFDLSDTSYSVMHHFDLST
jgi:hypothetical protein